MLFLIDENLPASVGEVFKKQGFGAECVADSSALRGSSDETIFEYAARQRMIVVTRDLRFANPTQFPLDKIPGIVIIRFPNEISIATLCAEIGRLTQHLHKEEFERIIVIEPGSIRARPLP